MTNNLPAELKDYWVQNEIIMPADVNSWAEGINQLSDAIPLYAHTGNFYTATYSNNVYNLTPLSFQDSTSNVSLSSYTEGMTVSFICPAANSASCQVKIGSLDTVPIRDIQNNIIREGFFRIGYLITLVYSSANQYFKVYNQAVQKTGDTMTGPLDNMNTSVTKGTNPSVNKYWEWRNLDNNQNPAEWHTNRMSAFQTTLYPNGTVETQIKAFQNDPTVSTTADIKLAITSSGVKSCEFPNTTCCDGQWVRHWAVLSTSTAQGNYQIDLSSRLPSDYTNYDYEVMVHFAGYRSSGTTNSIVTISDTSLSPTTEADLNGNMYGSANFDGEHAEAGSISCIVIARKNDAKFWLNITRANLTSGSLAMTKYRRIGTNA